jgi:hypothetical protein
MGHREDPPERNVPESAGLRVGAEAAWGPARLIGERPGLPFAIGMTTTAIDSSGAMATPVGGRSMDHPDVAAAIRHPEIASPPPDWHARPEAEAGAAGRGRADAGRDVGPGTGLGSPAGRSTSGEGVSATSWITSFRTMAGGSVNNVIQIPGGIEGKGARTRCPGPSTIRNRPAIDRAGPGGQVEMAVYPRCLGF